MKYILLLSLLLAVENCFGGTGNASDGELLLLVIVLLLLLPLAVVYLIDFLKIIIHGCLSGRRMNKHNVS